MVVTEHKPVLLVVEQREQEAVVQGRLGQMYLTEIMAATGAMDLLTYYELAQTKLVLEAVVEALELTQRVHQERAARAVGAMVAARALDKTELSIQARVGVVQEIPAHQVLAALAL